MAKQFPSISAEHRSFIERQHMYFVGTAARDGRVNVSPKGLDSLRVLGPNRVMWLNGTGSGNETAAHILDSPRMTLMFCAFENKPLIMRLYGTAVAIHEGEPGWEEALAHFPPMGGARNVFDLEVELVMTSCGFGVPLYDYVDQRTLMPSWSDRRSPEAIRAYQQQKNRVSIDGLPTGLPQVHPA